MRSGNGQVVVENAIIELPAFDLTTIQPCTLLRVRVRAIVTVVVAAQGPIQRHPGHRLPVCIDVAKESPRSRRKLIRVDRVERIVETATVQEGGRTRIGKAPRTVKSRRRI